MDLAREVSSAYEATLLSQLRTLTPRPRVLITPVQTVGALKFNRFDIVDDEPVAKFQGGGLDGKYEPQWTLNPLARIVEAAITHHRADRDMWTRVVEFVGGRDAPLRAGLVALTGSTRGPEIEVIPRHG